MSAARIAQKSEGEVSRNPAPINNEQRAMARTISTATMPFTMASAVKPYLRQTPEYAQARSERRAKQWLDDESLSLGYALAEVITRRLDGLDP